MAVVMSRKRVSLPALHSLSERSLLRAIKTFSGHASVGMIVAGATSRSKQEAVAHVAKIFKRSERYVWGTVKLGSKVYAAALATLEKLTRRNKHSRPRTVAAFFLLRELRNEARPAKEIEALAGDDGIAISTLRRSCKALGVKKKRVGGRNGFWSWELPSETKINFVIGD
jgi:hypothetical protein